MKLVRKLTIALFPGILVVLAVSGWLHVRQERRLYERDTRHDHHDLGHALSSAVAEIWKMEGRDAAMAFLAHASAPGSQVQVRWVDALPDGGKESMSVDRSGPEPSWHTLVPVTVDGTIVGGLELAESLQDEQSYVRATVQRTTADVLLLALFSGVMASLLGVWLVGRPMHVLVDRARELGAGNLTAHIHLDQDDELAELAEELNASGDRLADAQSKLATETAARIATLEQLRHADRLTTVGKLASGLAHELGTPLNVVLMRARMIATGEIAGEAAKGDALAIADQTERIIRIIRQLLDFARRTQPQKESLEVCEVVNRALSMLAPFAQKRGVTLQTRFPTPPVVTEVDGNQIQQVVTNLAVNGIQSMPSGGVLTVAVAREHAVPPPDRDGKPGEWVRVSVEDQGTGIAPDVLPRIFEPFFTTKDVGEGSGLGLSVSYGLVQDHGGWIDVKSEPGKGSCFSVFLP
jgi:signal transduction histidine kinase